MQCARLCNRVGLKSHSNAVPARHLDSEHPQIQAVKAFVERCGETHGIHKRLICNFDQVWTTNYNHSKRVIHKPVEHVGVHKEQQRPSIQKMMKSIRQALSIEDGHQQNSAAGDEAEYTPKPVILNAQANVTPIENWRFPRTTTTLSWSDGELATAWITVREGKVSDDVIKKLNEEMSGLLHIHAQDSKSHMWNSTTMLHFLQWLSVQLRLKRMKHKLSTKDRALVFCDKASVHACQAFYELRRQWEHENCAIICHGSSSEIKVPPGWGAAGAPNDGFHQFYHLLRQSFQKVATGQGRYLKLRAALDKLDLAVDGSVRFTMLDMYKCVFLVTC